MEKKELDFALWQTYLDKYCIGCCKLQIPSNLVNLTKDQLEAILKAKKNKESKVVAAGTLMRRGKSSLDINGTNSQVNMLLDNVIVENFFYFMQYFPHNFEFEDIIKKDGILAIILWAECQNAHKSSISIDFSFQNKQKIPLVTDKKRQSKIKMYMNSLTPFTVLEGSYMRGEMQDYCNYINKSKSDLLNNTLEKYKMLKEKAPFHFMEKANPKANDWKMLYIKCIELYADANSILHDITIVDEEDYRYACYLAFYLNQNSPEYKINQLTQIKANFSKKNQREKDKKEGYKHLDIKIHKDIDDKLKFLRNKKNLTQDEVIAFLIEDEYKKLNQ